MERIGPVKHPVKLLDGKIVEFNFEYFESKNGRYAVAYLGDIVNGEDVVLRIESSCIFGHVFGVVRCDCQYQLSQALLKIANSGKGLVVYAIDQDARGLGIAKHFEIYVLRQQEGLDTEGVYDRLKCKPDERNYDDVIEILNYYKIKSIKLLTNNPRRIKLFEDKGIECKREPIEITLNESNYGCLMDEKKDLGYLFSFKTHEEWFNYITTNIKDNNSACIITKDFKNILFEGYGKDNKVINILKTIDTDTLKNEKDLTIYVYGNIDEECLKYFQKNNINNVFINNNNFDKELSKKYNKKINYVEC